MKDGQRGVGVNSERGEMHLGNPPKRGADMFVEKNDQRRNQLVTTYGNEMETSRRLQARNIQHPGETAKQMELLEVVVSK